MKVIIAGSRGITDLALVYQAVVDSGFHITEVVSGCATGPDQLGEQWAEKMRIPVKRFPAEWGKYGRSAGIIRNGQMAEYAQDGALICLYDGSSRGAQNMIKTAERLGMKVYVKRVTI